VAQQRAHLGGRQLVSINDKAKLSITHTIGELGCDFDSAALLNAFTVVSARRERSSSVGATTAKYETADIIFAMRRGRH